MRSVWYKVVQPIVLPLVGGTSLKVLPRFELGLPDSKSRVLTITL